MVDSKVGLLALLALVVAVWACGDDAFSFEREEDTWDPFDPFDPSNWPSDAGSADAGMAVDANAADVFVPEEEELSEPVLAPTASRRFVFVANPSQNLVAKIDSQTLAVTPIPVGREPRIVQTSPGGDTAVVLNVASDTLSIIDAAPVRDRVDEVDILQGCNRLVLSPDARHAIAWYDNASAARFDEIGSLQSVALVKLDTGEAFDVSVGFNVREVSFSPDGARAFAVSDGGITILELDAIERDVALGTIGYGDGIAEVRANDREVRIGDAGRFAVVRASSFAGLRVVDLATDETLTVELPAIPSDIDLAEGGRVVYAALRDEAMLARVRFSESGAPPSVDLISVPDTPVGTVALAESAGVALSITTSTAEASVGIISLSDALEATTVALRKPAQGLLAAPASDRPLRAIVLHAARPGEAIPGGSIPELIDQSHGISLLDVSSRYAKLELLPSEPLDWVFSSDARHAFLMHAAPAQGVQELTWVDLDTFSTRRVPLDAPPEAIGIVPETGLVFVAQESVGGRITFLDPTSGDVRHVTAFELNAYID